MLLASPVAAEPCKVERHGPQDIRVECEGGGSYGVRRNQDGSVDELKRGRMLGIGPKIWKATRLGRQPAPESDPISVAVDLMAQVGDLPAAADGPKVIDAMIVWTPRAQTNQGGESAIRALVTAAVALANNAYASSGVGLQLRLVVAQRVEYVETTISQDLSRLSSTIDAFLPEVHTLRNQYGADVVTLIGDGYAGAGSCGLGYFMGTPGAYFAGSAFNAVDRSCAGGYLSYAHEVGHNQGLHHDPPNAGCGTTCSGYHYGYQDPGGSFRTVMSYGGAPRVQMFSSATLLYNGKPAGTATQDNSRRLRDTMAVVAAFRASVVNGRRASAVLKPQAQ